MGIESGSHQTPDTFRAQQMPVISASADRRLGLRPAISREAIQQATEKQEREEMTDFLRETEGESTSGDTLSRPAEQIPVIPTREIKAAQARETKRPGLIDSARAGVLKLFGREKK